MRDFFYPTFAALVLGLYPRGRTPSWIVRTHLLLLMRSTEQDTLYRYTAPCMVALLWTFLFTPVANLAFLAAQMYAGVLQIREDAMTQQKLRSLSPT